MMKKFLANLGRQWPLTLLSSASLLAYAALAGMDWRYGTLRAAYTPQSIVWYGVAFFAYLGLLIWAEKRGISKGWM